MFLERFRSSSQDRQAGARVQNPSLCHINPERTRPHWRLTLPVRSTHLNIANKVKPWHKAAPWLMSAATILGLIVIFHN
jgi:hypothetical protein